MVVLALFVWAGFQTFQLIRERGALRGLRAGQEPTIQEATKVRTQLDSIARRTAELAAQGNASAKMIVEELRKRGVTIDPNAPTVPLAPPTK
jgi:hypothetical protein